MIEPAKIVLVDDHVLLRGGLANLVANEGYTVLYECGNGIELMNKIAHPPVPDLILMDINMPEMNGFETALWLKENHPHVKIIALSMYDDDMSIIRMIKNGARGFMLKNANPAELKEAISSVLAKGFYYSELVSGKLVHSIRNEDNDDSRSGSVPRLSKRHIEFLKFACTELTYKEIAEKMHVSPRTIDGYRDELFQDLGVKSRVGLAMFAIKNKVVQF